MPGIPTRQHHTAESDAGGRGYSPTKLVVVLVTVFVLLSTVGTSASAGIAGTNVATAQEGEAFFEVEIIGTNSPVPAGERLVVDARITNTGSATDAQQIHLKDFNSDIVDSIKSPALTLEPGESQKVSLVWRTSVGDEGTGEVSVQSDDHYPRVEVTITEPTESSSTPSRSRSFSHSSPEPEFELVRFQVTPTRSEVGDTIQINLSVENSGDADGEYDAHIFQNDTVIRERTVEVEEGETRNLTFTHAFESAGTYELSTNGGLSELVDATEPNNVSILTQRNNGSGLTVSVSDATVNSSVRIPMNGTEFGVPGTNETAAIDNLSVSVGSVNVTPAHDVTFDLHLDSFSEPPNGTSGLPEHVSPITYLEVSSTLGDALLEASFDISATDNQTRFYRYDANNSTWVTLDSTTLEHTGNLTRWAAETHGFSAFAFGIREPSFTVQELELERTRITQGESADATVYVSNIGKAPGTYTVHLTMDGTSVESADVFVPANETREITMQVAPESPGEYGISVGSVSMETLQVDPKPTPTTTTTTTTTSTPTPTTTATATTTEPDDDVNVATPGFGFTFALLAVSGSILLAWFRRTQFE